MPWIFAHLLGDFILQNDWMAANKKKSSLVCCVHVLIYLLPFLFIFNWWQLLLIGLQHYFQDRTEFVVWFMKAKGSKNFTLPPMAPWSIILTDNILHILFIWIVSRL
jgi:hypothetical protein